MTTFQKSKLLWGSTAAGGDMTREPPRWLPALVEKLLIGDVVRFGKPPKVISAYGKDPFDAPGTQGTVIDFSNSTASARVRFQLQTADGAVQYSGPLTVIAGQRCEVNR